jgi:predicted acylesterase/phospholipase RssA
MEHANIDNTRDATRVPQTPTREKLGLAMSGGGFRAAFFHVGVLAQMSRLGLLRHVEVISTVSGGSIVGALYYLHVKRLLEEKSDEQITDQDYVAILQQLEVEFLQGVQRNIRLRTFVNPMKNLRMAFANYSRTDHIGELYDSYLYRGVFRPPKSTPIEMRELKIQPKGAKPDFSPMKDNADRANKVPILLINATTLNTGHNWRFEAVRMGEPPLDGAIQREIDKNLRLRRPPHYNDIIPKQQNIELGLAVAASACVPALFTPLAISDLYPDGIRVQLVDGGVHDNQGIEALLDMQCTRLIISDAAGQMNDEPEPSTQTLTVFSRSNNILMDRIREEELCTTLQTETLRVAFMHLRKGLYGKSISWIGTDGKPAEEVQIERPPNSSSKSFGVAEEVQDLLSRIRTDLDSFTDVEAYSLMLDGYKMSEQELRQVEATKSLVAPAARFPQWHFLKIEPFLLNPTPEYLRQLNVAHQNLFKVYKLSRAVTIVTLFVLAALAGTLWHNFGEEFQSWLAKSVTIGYLLFMLAMTVLGIVTPFLSRTITALRWLRAPSDLLFRLVARAVIPALGSVFVVLHLMVFDRLFLRRGKVDNL